MLQAYKKDQGRLARMAAFWSMAFLTLFGCMFLYDTLTSLVESLRPPIGGMVVPIVGIELNGAFLISAILFVGSFLLLYNWHQKPKVANLLIDTESELRKVTWPGPQEVVNSSLVVVVFVLVLMGFLAGADLVLGRFFTWVLIGG